MVIHNNSCVVFIDTFLTVFHCYLNFTMDSSLMLFPFARASI